ncbi:YciI family protein [Alteribacillus sp. YIM 98480]|uniref:YciI family protein n=1 Tax=Alteribacillus sp. YIM 98480 TaxID=2606599 RepID=UPI00131B149D|nr:YciI family protein [Alteribacillus sp. YIM 98480]
MKLFAVFLSMKDQELSQKHRPAHLEFLQKQHKEGNVAAYGRLEDGAGGLVIYRTETYEQAEELVKKDPYVVEGARGYDIHEWNMISDNWS